MDRSEGRVSPTTVSAVLRTLAARPRSRAEIMAEAALSRPSVSAAVAELLAAGLVEESVAAPVGRGRPTKRVRLSTRRADTVGIELGRRHVAVAVTDGTGAVVAAADQEARPASALEARARQALTLLDDVADRRGIDLTGVRRAAVGTPGPRFAATGRTPADFNLARLERERGAVAELVHERFGVPIDVGNNTRYTAVAEAHRRASDIDLVYLRVDEGIGGGIVQHGEPATGAIGAAGEIGHVSVDPLGDRCPCGGRGCLELVSSLPAVLRAAAQPDPDALRDHADEPAVRAAIERAATATGGVLAGVLALTNPSVVVIGGSVASLPGFLDRVEVVTRDAAPTWATLDLVVEAAATDHQQGAVGAATAASAALETVTTLARKDA